MNLRQFNQEIAPPDNAALPGLTKYQAAQQTEQALSMGLTGVPAIDVGALNSLKSDIMAGIKLNEENLQAVSDSRSKGSKAVVTLGSQAVRGCRFDLVFPNADQSA